MTLCVKQDSDQKNKSLEKGDCLYCVGAEYKTD